MDGITSNQVLDYLALLGDPHQNQITEQAWTVATTPLELAWAGWQPESVLSIDQVPPAHWHRAPAPPTPVQQFGTALKYAVAGAFLLGDGPQPADHSPPPNPPPGLANDGLRDLAARDELHREESLGRVGWIFIAGQIRILGQDIPCCFPLFERTVKFERVGYDFVPNWQSALRRNTLLRRRGPDTEEDAVDRFLFADGGASNPADLARRITDLLSSFDITVDQVVEPDVHPTTIDPSQGTVVVLGAGFYLARPDDQLTKVGNDLSRWTDRYLADTAVAHLYRTTDSSLHEIADQPSRIRTALPLNARQREAIDRLDTEEVVTVSGPPGTGKTHMIVAAASDLVARGLSVLVATKSNFAAESVCELLEYYPTPPHVRFGNDAHRRRVADDLSTGQAAGPTNEQIAELNHAEASARQHRDNLATTVMSALKRKQAFERARASTERSSADGAPRVLEANFDIAKLDRLMRDVGGSTGLQGRLNLSRLRRLIGAPGSATLATMQRSIAGAQDERAVQTALDAALGDDLDDLWAQLDRADTDARATQAVVDIARRAQPTPEALSAISALATALRGNSGPRPLRVPIEVNSAFLTHVPFWVGTLEEVEASLPLNPGMFDVVIFDEASQIDQLSAAPALCRAKQVMVVGDPRQLRHIPRTTPQQIQAARIHAGLGITDQTTMLDIGANSLFDVATAVSPITWLDEHFRSAPHLIQFSSERWYRNELKLMTQHPRNENLDVIDIYRVEGRRSGSTNPGEVEAIVARLRELHQSDPTRSVAVITPFETQAKALERAIVDHFAYDVIRDMRLRVGTVRGVQGTERDLVLLSLTFDESDLADALPIVEDPHLFNVMITRARSRMEVFHSFDVAELPVGLLADWLHYEKHPPGIGPRSSAPPSRWTAELAKALDLAGVRVVTGYPVAGWNIDLVIGEGRAAFGIETTVHPAGPVAHVERHLTLRRAGWDLVSVFEPSWLLKTQDAAIYLAGIAGRRARG